MKTLIFSGAVAVVALGVGTGLYFSTVESATVRISLPSWKLQSWAVVHGTVSGGQFRTTRLQVTATDSASGSASGTAEVAATYATGFVVFTRTSCPPQNLGCSPPPARTGQEVCRINPAGGAWCYVLQATVTCYCGERVPVRARGPGSTFNAPSHTVTFIEWGNPYATVDNPAPISGGADRGSYRVVTQSDIDAAVAGVRTQVAADLQSALRTQAQGFRIMPDGAPSIVVASNVDAGVAVSTFEVTASGNLGATAFRDSDAQGLITRSLSDKVPDGFRLTSQPVLTDYQVKDVTAQGDVTVTGEADGYLVAKFSTESLRSQLRGLDTGAAQGAIESVAPGSLVDIRLNPVPAPWLPMNGDRISISIAVRPPA